MNDRFQVQDECLARELWAGTGLAELVLDVVTTVDEEKDSDSAVDLAERSRESERKWGGRVVGLNPNIRIYRYGKGQFFDKHCELASLSKASFISSCIRLWH